jgi:hypothetical protein
MEITLNTFIPDDVAADLQNGSTTPLPRRLLELAANSRLRSRTAYGMERN